MSHLGIVVALRDEASSLTESKPTLRTPISLTDNVTLMVSGMGAAHAVHAARDLLDRGVTALMSYGTAAGLAPALRSGDVILADYLLDAQGTRHEIAGAWSQILEEKLTGVRNLRRGGICQSDTVIATPADKAGLYRRTGCLALDMESAALAALAGQTGVPFISLRAVVDTADMSLPASLLTALDEDGNVSLTKLLPALLPRPADWLALVKLARAFAAASHNLSRCRQLAGVHFLLQN